MDFETRAQTQSEYSSPLLDKLMSELEQNQKEYGEYLNSEEMSYYKMVLYPYLITQTMNEISKEKERLRILNNDHIDMHPEHVMD